MKILIWGLGYVGAVTAACLAHAGHEVIGVEPQQTKVELLNAGASPIKEPGLPELIRAGVDTGRLRATTDGIACVSWADLSLICVGTPSNADGSTRLTYLQNVAEEIGQGLRQSPAGHYHTVILRSTVFPGTTRNFLLPLLEEHSGRRAGEEFGLVMNPEFLRETSAINDFHTPPYTVIGALDERAGRAAATLYETLDAPLHLVSLEEAELLKLLNNAFHSLKIGFANEAGRLSNSLGIDSHRVMDLVCADTRLNISPAYLRPGFAFGGSCLPKDLRSLTHHARLNGVSLPILESVLPSNELQVELARLKVHQSGARRVAVLGLSFKAGTDDLRESPIISLIRQLWQDGLDILVHDPDVRLDEMLGSNKRYLERQLPQIHDIFRPSLTETLADAQLLIVSQRRPEFIAAVENAPPDVAVLDLVRLFATPPAQSNYQGIVW